MSTRLSILTFAAIAMPAFAMPTFAQQSPVVAPTPAPAPVPNVSVTPRAATPAPTPRVSTTARGWAPVAQGGYAYTTGERAEGGFEMLSLPAQRAYPQDPADSVYREARSLLNRGEWRRSATLFGQVAARQPVSAYAADALYWQAFALYRIGGASELREALAALESRKSRFPRAGNEEEAEMLMTRVNGALAMRGDATAAGRVRARASAAPSAASTGACDSEELSVRASALSVLMRNDPAAATPILARVLDRRDECSIPLRENAVMILGRQEDPAARARLLDVAKNDPAHSVRADAIGYLADVNTDEVATTLDGIVRSETDANVQRSAVRALGRMSNPKAKTAIRALIERTSAPERLRLEAIGTFDRRASIGFTNGFAAGFGEQFTFAYSCDEGQCEVPAIAGVRVPTPPAPPAPVAAPAPVATPRPAVSPRAPTAFAMEAEAAAVDARRAAVATTLRSDERLQARASRSDEDRRISPEDAAWLRGIYPRLETNRLKSAVVAVLARAGDDATNTWLMQMIQREEEPVEVRSSILSRLGRDLPIAQLGRLYDGASSRNMRTEIVRVLGRRDEPEATDKLIEIVRTGTDPQLRRAAISALNGKKDPRTTQLLLELIDK